MLQHAKALMCIHRIPEGNHIASLLYPSRCCSNQQAIAHWVEHQLLEQDLLLNADLIQELAILLAEHFEDLQDESW